MGLPAIAIALAGIVMSLIMTGAVLFHLARSHPPVRAAEFQARPARPTAKVRRWSTSPVVIRGRRVGMRLANAFLVIGLLSLIVGGTVYGLTREPVRLINVRWREGLSEAERLALQQRYALRNCRFMDERTESCEILVQTRGNLSAIVRDRAIEDTHYFDRGTLVFADPAHLGTGYTWAANAIPMLRRSDVLERVWLSAGALVIIGLLPRLFGTHPARWLANVLSAKR